MNEQTDTQLRRYASDVRNAPPRVNEPAAQASGRTSLYKDLGSRPRRLNGWRRPGLIHASYCAEANLRRWAELKLMATLLYPKQRCVVCNNIGKNIISY